MSGGYDLVLPFWLFELVPRVLLVSHFQLLRFIMPPRRGGGAAAGGDVDDFTFRGGNVNRFHARLVFEHLGRNQAQWFMRCLYRALDHWYRTCHERSLEVRQGVRDALGELGEPSSGASGAGERKEKSSVSTTTSTFDGSPQEKSLSEFLSDGNRFKRDLGHKNNLELFTSKLRSSYARLVTQHQTWPQYVISSIPRSAITVGRDTRPHDSLSDEFDKALLMLRSFADTLTEAEIADNSNLGYLNHRLPMRTEFDGDLDMGPCMAQIRLYRQQPLQWPPHWNVGRVSRRSAGIVDTALVDALHNFLVLVCTGYYRQLCAQPLEDHHFMPSRFRKGDPFYGITMSFQAYLKWDDFLANAWLQLCDVGSIGQSELPWFHQLRQIMDMPMNPHKFHDMLCVSNHFCSTLATVDISDIASRLMVAMYDPNIVAEHYLDYLIQLKVESEKQFKKLTHRDAIDSFSHISEKTVIHRFANSMDMYFKSEPAEPYMKGLWRIADAWRSRTRPEMMTESQRKYYDILSSTDKLMAELRQLTSDCGRSGTAPPAKYQLRRSSTTLASGSRALIVHDSSDVEEAYRASQYSHDDTSSSTELQPFSQSLSPYDSAYYGGQPHSPPSAPPTPSPFFRPSFPPFARPPLPSPNSYAPSSHHRGRGPPRGRGRGRGNFSGRGPGRGSHFGPPSGTPRPRFAMADQGYYGLRIPRPPRVSFHSPLHALARGPPPHGPPPRGPPFARGPPGSMHSFHGTPRGPARPPFASRLPMRGRGRGQGSHDRSPNPDSANAALSALLADPSLPPEAAAHIAAAQAASSQARVAGENAHADDSFPGADAIHPDVFGSYEISDPNTLYNAYEHGSEETDQTSFDQAHMAQVATGHEMQSFAWNDNELNYLADQMQFNDDSNAYYGVTDDYNNEWQPDDYGYLTLETDTLNDIIDSPRIFNGDNMECLLRAAVNIDNDNVLTVADSGASRFYWLRRLAHRCLVTLKLPFMIPIGTANGIIRTDTIGFRCLFFKRNTASAFVLLQHGLLAEFPESKNNPAIELGSITALNQLGFDVLMWNTLFNNEPKTIQSAHNPSCCTALISGIGKLPLLDLLDPDQAAGLELFSFIDDTPWCPDRDARAAHECAKLHDDRLAPFIGTMAKQIGATFGSGNFASFPASQRNVITSSTPAATIKIDTHVPMPTNGDDSEAARLINDDNIDDADQPTCSTRPNTSNSTTSSSDFGSQDTTASSRFTPTRFSPVGVLRVFLICFGIATTAALSAFGLPIKFVGGLEINDTLHAEAARRHPHAVLGRDLRKYEKDLRKGKRRPVDCDLIEGTVTCQSRCTLRWTTRPSAKHINAHDLFFVQLRVIGYTMPKYVVLELTPPDNENAIDYERCETMISQLGYNVNVTRRTPSALCGDATCRFRWILIGVRTDCAVGDIDLRRYLADEPSPMRPLLDPPDLIPDHLWLDPDGVIPRTTCDAGEKPGIDDIIDKSTWGASTFANLIGWHTHYGKGFRIYDIDHTSPTITSFANIIIYDDRFEPGVRQLTVPEMCRFSSFDDKTTQFLLTLPEHDALQCIANAVPMGLLSTVYTAILDHAKATRHLETAFVTLRSGKEYGHPISPPIPTVVSAVTSTTPSTNRPPAAPSTRSTSSLPTTTTTIPNTPAPAPVHRSDYRPTPSGYSRPAPRLASSVKTRLFSNTPSPNPVRNQTPGTIADHWSPTNIPTTESQSSVPHTNPVHPSNQQRTPAHPTTARIDLDVPPTSTPSPAHVHTSSCGHHPNTSLPSADPATDSQGAYHDLERESTPLNVVDGSEPIVDDEGNHINPHLTRDASNHSSRGTGARNNNNMPLDVNPRFGRLLSEPKSTWPTMEPPGSPAYRKAVDRILKLHQTTAHATGEMLEHVIEHCINHNCLPGDSRYLPVCNECLLGGYDSTRRNHSSLSTSKIELIRKYLPGEYWIFDVNELPVYSSFGHFRYAFTCVCPVSQYLFVYYATDVGTATYLDFCNAIVTEVRMRLRRSPTVFYSDDFSTFSQQFEVALAYSEFGIEHLETPPEMHWLNGIAENAIRVLTRKTRINLSQLIGVVVNGVKIRDPQPFWPFAMENAKQLYNVIPNRVLHRTFGVPFAPIQIYTNNTEFKVDLNMFHRFGDLCYVVDYVRDRAGKLAPVAYRAYYLFNPSWSTITKKYCDMSKADVVLSAKDNKLICTGMAKYPNESLMHPRAYAEPSVAMNSPTTTVRAHDDQPRSASSAPTSDVHQTDPSSVIHRDGSISNQSRPTTADAAPDAAPNAATDIDVLMPNTQMPDWLRRDLAPEPPAPSHTTPTEPIVPQISHLPPPAVLRHRDYPISFAPGAKKSGAAASRFGSYKNARTTREYFQLGGRNADWNWDVARKLVIFRDSDLQTLADDMFHKHVARSSARRVADARKRQQSRGPTQGSVAANAARRNASRGRFAALAAFFANIGHYSRGSLGNHLQNIADASSALALRATSHLSDCSLDVSQMANAYRTMVNHTPHEYKLHAIDVDDDLLDHLLLFSTTVDEIAFIIHDQYNVVLDESVIASLKDYNDEMRSRMARAIHKEISDLIKVGTFELMPLPNGRQAIGSKLVLKVKFRADGTPDKDKARLLNLSLWDFSSELVLTSSPLLHQWPV